MKRRLPLVLAVTVSAASSSSLRGANQVVATTTGDQSGALTSHGGSESGLRRRNPIQRIDSSLSTNLPINDVVRLLGSNYDDEYVASSTADDDSVSIYDAHGDDDRVAKYVSMIQNWETTAISKFHDFETTANTTAWEFYESPPSSWTQQQWDLVIDLLIGLFVFVSLSLICFVNCCCAAQDMQDKGFSPPTSPTMYEGKPFSPAASTASQDSRYFDQRSFLASSRGSFLGRLMSTVTPKATGRSKKYSVSPSPRNRRPSRSRSRSRHRSAVRGGRGRRGNSRSGRRSRRSMSFDDSETILSSEYEDESTVDSRSDSSYEPPESRSSFWSKASNSVTLGDDSCSYDEDETNAGSVELSRRKKKSQKKPLPNTIIHDRSKSMASTVVSDITKETATMGSLSLQASSTRTMTPLNQLPEEEPQQETEVAIDQTSCANLKTSNVVVHAVDMMKPTSVVTDEMNDNTSAISTKSQRLVTDIRQRLNSKESCSKESNSSMSSKDSAVIRQRSSSERFKFDDIVRPSLSSFKMPGEWKKKKPTALLIDSNINDGITKMTMKGSGGSTFTDAAPRTTVNTSQLSPIIDETPRASDTLIHVDGRDHIVSEGIEVPTRGPITTHNYISTQKESKAGSSADHIAMINLPKIGNPTTFDGSVKTAKINNKSSKDLTAPNSPGKSGTEFLTFTRNELAELRQQSVIDSNNNKADSQKERVGSPHRQREKVAAAGAEKMNGNNGGKETTKAVVLEELVRDVLTSTRNLDLAIADNSNKSRIRSSSKNTRRRVLVDEVTRRRRKKRLEQEKELQKNGES